MKWGQKELAKEVENINLNLKRGEFVCIVGDVGCGKSSLLSAINGDMLYIPESEIEQNLDGI